MSQAPIRKIVFFEDHFMVFYNKQPEAVKLKIDWTIGLIRDLEVVPSKYFKHITGTNLYEIRVSAGKRIVRIFCFFDKGKLVILINGFQKKTNKTPKKEIEKALKIQNNYFNEKER